MAARQLQIDRLRLRNSSASPRSFARPVLSLLRINSVRPMKVSFKYASGIRDVRVDQDVQVGGKWRISVPGDGKSPDYEIPSTLFELSNSTNSHKSLLRCIRIKEVSEIDHSLNTL